MHRHIATYSCNGRAALPVILHTHKPIDVVVRQRMSWLAISLCTDLRSIQVLALGVNDLKSHFALTPNKIAQGLACLIHDIQTHDVGAQAGIPPKVGP